MTGVSVPGHLLAGRYATLRVLKRGHDVNTLLAVDHTTGAKIVVKTTSAAALAHPARLRLEHEARVLADVDSPWIAPLLDLGQEGDVLYVVMPYVPGETLAKRLAAGPLDVRDALAVGRCLLGALARVHDAGVLHCDVKPSNIIVSGDPAIESATLVDFGLASSHHLPLPLQHEVAGTVRYMPPEQAGLLERPVDERTDLYAAGIVLFECLAGRPPFEADETGALLRQHLTAPVPSIRGLGVAVPRVLEEIVQRLLRKDPDDRYQSARGAAADLEAVAEAVDRGIAEPAIVVGSHDHRHTLTEPVLAGRDAELAALEAHVEEARQGHGRLVLLEAESGGGKTRLLEELALRAGRDAWVLRGQAFFQAAPRPLQLLGGVIAGVAACVEPDRGAAGQLRARLGAQDLTALSEFLPELAASLGQPSAGTLSPEAFGEERIVHGLVALMAALGTSERPAVVLLDDCQWADDLALRLLGQWAEWTTRDDRPPCHSILVASFRSEEVTGVHPLRRVHAPRLRLDPLSPDQISQLAESMAGGLPAPAMELIQNVARGNPFMASAVLRGLVEAGTLVHRPAGWWFDQTSAAPQWSNQAATFLARRLDLVSADTQALLTVGAVLGKEFRFELAATLAGLDATALTQAVREAHDRHLMWTSPDGNLGTFAHDRLRDAFLERITAERRAGLHLEAAQTIEATEPDQVFELAYHFDAAGHPTRALPFALKAGTRARSRHLLELAEANFRIAERGAQRSDRATRQHVAEELGQMLLLRGRYEEAAERLELAATLAADPLARASIEGQLGELAFKQGDVQGAARRLEGSLRILGERVPRTRVGFVAHLCWETLVQVIQELFRPRIRRKDPDRALLVTRLYGRLVYAWWFGHKTLATITVNQRMLNVARRSPESRELGHAYAIYGVALSAMFPLLNRRGLAFTTRAMALQERLGDLWGQGQATSFHGVVLHAAGRYEEAVAACDTAIALLDRTGDPWERNAALWHKAIALHRLGKRAAATESAQALYQAGLRLGEAQSRSIGLSIWAKASGGLVPAQPIADALDSVGGGVTAKSLLLQADGIRLLAEGSSAAAIDRFRAAADLMRSSGTANTYVVTALAWLATAYRQAAEAAPPLAADERRRLIRRGKRAARRALRYARLWPNDRPHALREAGLVAALAGRPRRARRLLDRGLAVADRQGARGEWAETLSARAKVGLAAGWPGAADDLTRALEARQALEPAPAAGEQQSTLDVADRYRTLLDAGRRITAATSTERLLSTVAETANALLRAEHCTVVRVTADGGIVAPAGHQEGVAPSRMLLEQALAAKKAVVLTEAVGDESNSSDSIILTGVRSALCAPICIHGQPAACLVATHRQVAGLFGEDEVRLADFIAELAGAALEREQLQQEMRGRIVAAQEEQRARIARDLHDEIGQALTSVLVGLRPVQKSLAADVENSARLREVHEAASEALGQVQQLAFELRPSALDHGGLEAAVRRFSGDVAARHGLTVDVETADLELQDRLSPEIETTAYRVVQEALTNVVRHARATTCSVVLARRGRHLRVMVEDDGAGFDLEDVRIGALGLQGMAERAALVGGNLQVNSAPGQGTTIAMDVPLE